MRRSPTVRSPIRPFLATFALALLTSLPASAQEPYRNPPQAVLDVLDAPPLPNVAVSPDRNWLLFADRASMPSIAELSEPMLRLAGMRINPATNGPYVTSRTLALRLKRIDTGSEHRVTVPEGGNLGVPQWSPDNRRIAFTNTTGDGIELWVADVATGTAKRVTGGRLNGVAGSCEWLPDGGRLLCPFVVDGRGPAPAEPRVPAGPAIQQSSGRSGTIRTYQDLLRNPHDEQLFDYYFTSQQALVDVETGERVPVGAPVVALSTSLAPGGEHLLVTRTLRPYSYVLPVSAFPLEVEVWNLRGEVVHRVHRRGLLDNLPAQWTVTGPRAISWRPQQPATLVWAEALDGGNPKAEAEHRDRVLMLAAPFTGEPVEIARTGERFGAIRWSEGAVAMISDYERAKRWQRTWLFRPDAPADPWKLVWERNTEDAYGDPGTPLLRPTPRGAVLLQRGDWIYLSGAGASAEGDRPFLDRLNLTTLETERLWRSDADAYEMVVALLDDDARRVLTRRETPVVPGNYFLRDLRTGGRTALTEFRDPAPQLTGIKKELVTYTRKDGVPLNGTLYLPPDYRPGTRLPVVIWAYPREFVDADVAGQVRGSNNRFTSITGASHLFFLTQGYAVFDGPSMPIIGGDTANNTYVEQLVASAEAAVDKIVSLGVADRDRIGVGGHSYGAFMTANLLAHSDLFRAGIARSGAYNRSLTPFGFQAEERLFWEVPDLYQRMSPFWYAHRIQEPILLIHGEADNNSGTFPIQSERMFAAIKGNGGTVRLVMLPNESHGYAAEESVKHALHEMISWFDRYVKDAPARAPATD
ncbi:MAG TPA: prolyl oligopeptidase family serine peptidase [Longimicrobiales bacterium]|nr:prolyl oligopeptidase family serine peptidase [Longimicrobiales bacterium]